MDDRAADPDGHPADVLGWEPGARSTRARVLLGVAAAVIALVGWASYRQLTAPATARRPSAAPSPTVEPVPFVLAPAGKVRLLAGHRAAVVVRVTNPNPVAVTLLRLGESTLGIAFSSSVPTPVSIPAHASRSIVVTFGLSHESFLCGTTGKALTVLGLFAGVRHEWEVPLSVSGRPWDDAVATAICPDPNA